MRKNKTTSLMIVIFILFLIGTVGGFLFGKNYQEKQANKEILELKSQIAEAKKFFPPLPEFPSLTGTVKRIEGKTLIMDIETDFLPPHPFEKIPITRKVIIKDTTKFVKQVQKEQKVYQQEYDEYQKKLSEVKPNEPMPSIPYPNPFVEKDITLNDLKLGDRIIVDASENIKDKETFSATRVTLLTRLYFTK